MKMISIAAAMALAATPAFAATQVGTSYERSVPAREGRAARADLGSPRAGPEVPELQQGDPADSLYRRAREALNPQELHAGRGPLPPGRGSLPEVAVGAIRVVLPRVLALPDGERRSDARVA
jgi:hypothetical protein